MVLPLKKTLFLCVSSLSNDVFLSTTKSTLQWLDHFPMTIKIWDPSPWIKYFSLSISLLRMYKILVHYLHGAISILPYKARNQKHMKHPVRQPINSYFGKITYWYHIVSTKMFFKKNPCFSKKLDKISYPFILKL